MSLSARAGGGGGPGLAGRLSPSGPTGAALWLSGREAPRGPGLGARGPPLKTRRGVASLPGPAPPGKGRRR